MPAPSAEVHLKAPNHTVPQGRRGAGPQPTGQDTARSPSAPPPQDLCIHVITEGKATLSTLPSLLRGYQTNMDWEKEEGDAYPYYVYGAACSEVEVDCLTGAHKVGRCWAAHNADASSIKSKQLGLPVSYAVSVPFGF